MLLPKRNLRWMILLVIIDRETKKSLFWSHSSMALSAEILQGNRIVMALSTHADGNSIELYDIDKPEEKTTPESRYAIIDKIMKL